MKKIVFLAVAVVLLLVPGGVANADFPDVRAPDAPPGYREGSGRYSGSSIDFSTEEPQAMTGMPPLREIGYEPCLKVEQLYYTAACAEWGEWDPLWCHTRFWCRYVTPPADGACSGYPTEASGEWGWVDTSKPCQPAQPDPERPECSNGVAWGRTVCDGGYLTTYYRYTHYCVREWWCSASSGSVCSGLSLEMNAARRPTDESLDCQPDVPENPMCRPSAWPYIVVDCEHNPDSRFPDSPYDCVYSWWCGPTPHRVYLPLVCVGSSRP